MSKAAELTSFFPATKAKATTDTKALNKPASATASPVYLENTDKEDALEMTLRSFDLETKYGPCTGLSRLQRWERAAKLGLDPPMEIGRLLSQLPADDKKAANLWAGRV